MTNLAYVLTLLLFTTNICKADTVSYWHVYYNKTKIREYIQFMNVETIVLKISEIKAGDSITAKYFRDTPCHDCLTTLTVDDGKHQSVSINHGKGTFNPVSFAVSDLVQFKEKNNKDYFEIFYSEEPRGEHQILLFRIKLE